MLRRCVLMGIDAAYYGCASIIQMDDIEVHAGNRNVFRMLGSSLKAKHVFVGVPGADSRTFATLHSSDYGGDYSFEDISVDNEGDDTYSLAFFYCEPTGSAGTNLRVKDVYCGDVGPIPLFMLRCLSGPPSLGAAFIDAEGVAGDATGPIVDVDGSLWTGRLRNCGNDLGGYVTSSQAGGPPAVVVEDSTSLTFPRYGSWFAGTVRLQPPHPADAQYQEFRVGANGVCGSTTPPLWVGINAIPVNQNASLAAYATDHTAISATLSGHASSYGYLTYTAAYPLASALFGGTLIGVSTVLTLTGTGLGGGYTLSYGGQTTSSIAPTATAASIQAALQGLSSIGAGNAIVSGNPGGPYTIALSGTLSNLAGGALGFTVNASGLTGTGQRAILAPSGLPATWYVGLSTSPAYKENGGRVTEPIAVGYARVALPNSSGSFSASSAGSKANTAAITFPTATGSYTVQSIYLFDSATTTNPWAVIQLATPLTVAPGTAPTIPAGADLQPRAVPRVVLGIADRLRLGQGLRPALRRLRRGDSIDVVRSPLDGARHADNDHPDRADRRRLCPEVDREQHHQLGGVRDEFLDVGRAVRRRLQHHDDLLLDPDRVMGDVRGRRPRRRHVRW